MLLRTLSALVLVPLVLAALFLGNAWLMLGLLLLVAGGLLWEWLRLGGVTGETRLATLGLGWATLGLGVWSGWQPLALLFSLATVGLMGLGVFLYRPRPAATANTQTALLAHALLGVWYCVLPLLLLWQIWGAPAGAWWVCMLLVVVWANDTGAYLVGRRWGRRKLAPNVSPGKTWEGSVGGTLLGVAGGTLLCQSFPFPSPLTHAIVLTLILSVVSQVGDLAESLVKREAGVKDAGALIPGHGGLLDRLDSLLFTVPLLALYLWRVGILGP